MGLPLWLRRGRGNIHLHCARLSPLRSRGRLGWAHSRLVLLCRCCWRCICCCRLSVCAWRLACAITCIVLTAAVALHTQARWGRQVQPATQGGIQAA